MFLAAGHDAADVRRYEVGAERSGALTGETSAA
jgi:hypothetical protein